MTVYISSDTIYFVCDIVEIQVVGIYVFISVEVNQTQKFQKFIMYGKLRQFIGILRKIINIV